MSLADTAIRNAKPRAKPCKFTDGAGLYLEVNPSVHLRAALAPVVSRSYAAVTDPAQVADLLRALDSYSGQLATRCALRLATEETLGIFSKSIGCSELWRTDSVISIFNVQRRRRSRARFHSREAGAALVVVVVQSTAYVAHVDCGAVGQHSLRTAHFD